MNTLAIVTKRCPVCGCDLPLSEFPSYFSKERNRARVGNYCKPCGRSKSKARAIEHYKKNAEFKKEYAKFYRANTSNKEKIKNKAVKFKKQYREELKDCYVRDQLVQKYGYNNDYLIENPEIIETYRMQLKIKRKLKDNGKE